MSKRGRRRNSRRKSSSSSKQSVSPYIFQKQNKSNSVSYKDDIVEKGETDSLRKENVPSESEDEEKNNNAPPREKRMKQDYHVNSFPNRRSIYSKTTEDKEKGVRTVTSVSVSDMDDSSPKIMFQQSHEPLAKNPSQSLAPVTNIMNINCSASHVKLEIQESLQLNASGLKTTFVFMNGKGGCAEMFSNNKCEMTWLPNNESPEEPSRNDTSHDGSQNANYRFTFGSMQQAETHGDFKSASPTNLWDDPSYPQFCSDHKQQISTDFKVAGQPSSPPPLLIIKPQGKRKYFQKSFSTDHFWSIPPPREFADITFNTLEDLSHDLASCRIGACSPAVKKQTECQPTLNVASTEEPRGQISVEAEERTDTSPFFDQLSEFDNYEARLMRPSLSTNRSSFTKDFINCQKRKSWIRNNSIATVEHRACPLPKKRRQTFPGTSEGLGLMPEDLLLPCGESFTSLIMCSLPLQTEGPGKIHQGDDNSSSRQPKRSFKHVSEIPCSHGGNQALLSTLYVTSSEDNTDDTFSASEQCQKPSSIMSNHEDRRQQDVDIKERICKDVESAGTDDSRYKVDQSEVADSGIEQEVGEVGYHSPESLTEELSRRALSIQVIPPSCSGSEEQMSNSQSVTSLQSQNVNENARQENSVSVSPKHNKSSVMTITVGAQGQRFLQMDSRPSASYSSFMKKHVTTAFKDAWVPPSQHMESVDTDEAQAVGGKTGNISPSLSVMIEKTKGLQLEAGGRGTEDPYKPEGAATSLSKGSTEAVIHTKELLVRTDKAEKQIICRSSLDTKEHLKPVAHIDADSSCSDHWAKRRKLFKDSKQWSSTGGSSITSDITEESVSEDTRSMDVTVRDSEDRGFYTETFHSSAWIYQGDDADSGTIPPSLNSRARVVSIRERTVRISKGTGEYPWGFRIQFSKPIVVTEVDTNGAAEEAGLMVGDYVLAVNGTDVTSIPHSEAADLARQGPDVLTLTIGSDIARGPNTPRPACRGYLHKRTQSGLIKGWRKRWFVLTHDCCLYYYRHKRDEGKRQALSAVKLEGADVGPDVSLGKPFVFKCRPQSGNRVYFFCATSNQEMKKWLEAMERAIHPITQNHVWVDVTRHNSSLPPLAVKNPECLGLLHKMDKSKDVWVQHYCILKDGCLSLYSSIRATHAHGGIYLQGYMVREQPYGSKKSTIELKPLSDEFKTFYFCAENPNENKRWIIAIKASIKKWLPLHQALQDYMSRPSEETRM